jgi:hypothetical protein
MIPESDAGAQMSLNGNLEVFPLEEVLRLLARSRKTGCLRIESTGVQGRIFLNGGAMALATVAADDELRRRLIASGLIEEHDLRKVEVSGAPISGALAGGATPAALSDFVREESVEGLYRIRRSGRGSFDFLMELSPRYPTGQSFDAEVIVSESDRRALEWEDVESVLPSMETVLRMVPSLSSDDSVTLSPSTWQILAALGGGSSISQIGRTLGWSDFRSAREMAALFRNGLVTLVDPADSTRMSAEDVLVGTEPTTELDSASGGDGGWSDQPVVEIPILETPAAVATPAPVEEQTSDAPVVEAPFFEVSPAGTSPVEASIFESSVFENTPAEVSIFDTPVVEAPASPDAEAADVEEAAADDTQDDASSSWWSDTAAAVPTEESEATAEESATPDTPWNTSPWTAEVPTEEAPAESTPWGGWTSTPEVSEVSEVSEASEVHEAVEVSEVESPAEPISDTAAVVDPTPAEESAPSSDLSDTESVDTDRTGGWWAETMGAEEGEAAKPASENDADRFLESVFSSLSDEGEDKSAKAEDDDDETGFGMGLLRRRRMGAAARDISDNNNR